MRFSKWHHVQFLPNSHSREQTVRHKTCALVDLGLHKKSRLYFKLEAFLQPMVKYHITVRVTFREQSIIFTRNGMLQTETSSIGTHNWLLSNHCIMMYFVHSLIFVASKDYHGAHNANYQGLLLHNIFVRLGSYF